MKRAELRRQIYERDQGICGICGRPVAWDDFDIDHITPRMFGGSHDPSNLRVSHAVCNRRRAIEDRLRHGYHRGHPSLFRDRVSISCVPVTDQRLTAISRVLGMSRASVVHLAVAELARLRGIRVPADAVPPNGD